MPCRHSSSNEDSSPRREFLKAAVALGGTSVVSACLGVEVDEKVDTPEADLSEVPQGTEDPSSLPDRQHAWKEFFIRDFGGNPVFPKHHAILVLDYVGDDPVEDREEVERALRTLERAFQWGSDGADNAVQNNGLLFTVGYSASYFDRFDSSLPDGLDFRTPTEIMEELGETEPEAQQFDAAVHLASGYASVLLAAEETLFGSYGRLNGVDVEGTLEGVFERADRRTGFLGKGLPSKKYDHDSIADNAPLSMGFKAGFQDNLQSEDTITIREGPFAEGTIQLVSTVSIDLDGWYEEDRESQVKQMFTPAHTPEDVGEVGENLAGHSGKTPETIENIPDDAAKGLLGHGQKLAQARTDPEDGFEPRILRRDFDATGEPGLHFDGWMGGHEDFVKTRKAMNGEEYHDEVPLENNGILNYTDVKHRSTFLIPPRTHRAMPTPRPGQ